MISILTLIFVLQEPSKVVIDKATKTRSQDKTTSIIIRGGLSRQWQDWLPLSSANLRQAELETAVVDGKALSALSRFSKLERLELVAPPAKVVTAVLPTMHSIEYLALHRCDCEGDIFNWIRTHQRLRRLTVSDCGPIASTSGLRKLSKLEEVSLATRKGLSRHALFGLTKCPKLKYLALSCSTIGKNNARHISRMDRLEVILLTRCGTLEELEAMCSSRTLRRVILAETRLDDSSIMFLRNKWSSIRFMPLND